ncbi:hypothetical protein B0H16DRAFT_1513691 [Mycena metata]|uniref:NmrA-like domain-containing protein n=1 Tax=Mycena metata TaxID=1033252 RepID=A0AAD7JXF7_9AGAR|nr:hypothetical protein B0H16DRAFT_1513691 [Mycena metata]
MPAYKSFAVLGGGTIGLPIVEALASRNVSVVLFSRPGSPKKTVPSGVEVAELDFNDVAAVAAALQQHEVDVVLSTIGTAGTKGQMALADAAKLAGVKLFAPAEYGLPTDADRDGPLGEKKRIAEYLKALGIPTVRFYTGVFIEYIPWLTGYPEHNKIRVVGEGESPVSFTAVSDIAGFVAHVLTTLPPAELENHVFRLEGERRSFKELAKLFNTTIEHLDRIPGEMGEFKTLLAAALSSGAGSTGWDAANRREGSGSNAAGSAKAFWPDHKWKSIKEVLKV